MDCTKCKYHYIGKGYFCWSGNKSLGYCRNGKPTKNRRTYRVKTKKSFKEQKNERTEY